MLREDNITQIDQAESWDVIIIGGGATGLGAGVDAAARGYSTLLLEASDFSQSTSSRSTKLVHGGVRYMEQFNFALVYDALHERGTMRRNAPHLVYDQKFIVPTYTWWQLCYYGAGLVLYDLLSGPFSYGRSYPMPKNAALKRVPGMNPAGVKGGVVYHDGQFNDSRFAVTLALTMNDLGGCPVNHMRVVDLIKEHGKVCGVTAIDELSGKEYRIMGKVVINATGIFTDSIRKMDTPQAQPILRPSQGIHLVLDKHFSPGDAAILIPKTDDGRVVFIVPWEGKLLVGTTDTPVSEPEMEPRPLEEEIEFLIEHAGRYLAKKPARSDVRSVFNGIRPLIQDDNSGSTASLSRDHYLTTSPSNLVTIAGGKWTTYRKMAEDTISAAAKVAGLPERSSRTANLPLHGWVTHAPQEDHLHVYGADREKLEALLCEHPELAVPIHPDLPYLLVEVVWAVRHEMAKTLYDVLALRTRSLLLDAKATIMAAPDVAELMACELGLSGPDATEWVEEQLTAFTAVAAQYVVSI